MTLPRGDHVVVTQALGGSFTVQTDRGYLARIGAQDADALGLDATQGQRRTSGAPASSTYRT